MAIGSVSEKLRLMRLLARSYSKSSLKWFSTGLLSRRAMVGPAPARLLIAPQDLRTADAFNASDIYAGRFLFAGQLVETESKSPFTIKSPGDDWSRSLHGFSWLRHLRAAGTHVARKNARALVEDWIKECGNGHTIGWKQDVIARRVLSWLSQSPMLLDGCDAQFYRRFMRSMYRQVRYLRRSMAYAPDGVPRLTIAMAIACAYLCMEAQSKSLARALSQLDDELKRQLLPDGGHISRNPSALVEILVDLLPLRQAIVMRGQSPTPVMMESIDRMMPMLRFFRHGDGTFAHFNGMASTQADLVATILAYDDARGTAPASAPYSGYQRLSCNGALALIDCGAPPPIAHSSAAHAGCLAFEFSSRRNRIIVNCGVSARQKSQWRNVARSTAAHSTVGINDTSSCHILTGSRFENRIGTPVLSGPRAVAIERNDTELYEKLSASHDGYSKRFHLLHERELTLSKDGTVLDGSDHFTWTQQKRGACEYAIRFHLHPQVKCSPVQSGQAIILQCDDGEGWEFSAEGHKLSLEESIYLSDAFGHRRTSQIVIESRVTEHDRINWMLRKTSEGKGRRKSS
ncbi:heparinase II/III family protein [Polycladidibacter stylochi]|uniref:heparinase II/III family protein n=1 Tax=Polycladidibacter stylochi TaxID=1807766 RepID=UPI0008314143|nr:heparinase II/III family protein [Pseudovibrio stylochi]